MLDGIKVWSVLAVAVVLGACSSGVTDGSDTPPNVCSTSKVWSNGNHGSPLMHPGGECIACHSSGEGPRFTIAGTVMNALDDDTNCDGVSGATVEITDKTGKKVSLTSNAAGNFSAENNSGITFPITAKVIFGGKELAMKASQTDGDCNSCHGAVGSNGAPGRIHLP